MKNAFVNSVQLNHHIPGIPYRLQTDASDAGLSGVLYQIDHDGYHRIIALVSRCLNVAEMNYTTTQKELLAVVYSILKLRIYLLGTRFEVITDHKALTFLYTTPHLNARMIRWSLALQKFDFGVSHVRGEDNIVADFLSRNLEGHFESSSPRSLSIDVLEVSGRSEVSFVSCNNIDLNKELRSSLKNSAILQKRDLVINEIIKKVKNNSITDFYVIKNDILFRRASVSDQWQIVIPGEMT